MNAIVDSGVQHHEDEVALHVQKIRNSGILARSSQLSRLFEFLHSCYLVRRIPKEFEIAVDGLGRHQGFDVTQDALVRVYVHKLRRKIDEFYLSEGQNLADRLVIPKGEYRLILEQNEKVPNETTEQAAEPQPRFSLDNKFQKRIFVSLLCALLVSGVLNIVHFAYPGVGGAFSSESHIRSSSLWAPLFADDRPIVIVVGDYYTFAESDKNERVTRLVRDFEINSPIDLANYLQLHPKLAENQFDVGLSYLPTSSAYALNKLDSILNAGKKKPWGVILSSELIPENIRNSHIVYIGHLSALGVLEERVFANSGFRIGKSYDELVNKISGERYVSSSGGPLDKSGGSSQFAYLASFKGPTNNQIIVVAGFRDAGLRELADVIASEAGLAELAKQNVGASFETIYQTNGFGITTAPSKPLITKPLKSNVTLLFKKPLLT